MHITEEDIPNIHSWVVGHRDKAVLNSYLDKYGGYIPAPIQNFAGVYYVWPNGKHKYTQFSDLAGFVLYVSPSTNGNLYLKYNCTTECWIPFKAVNNLITRPMTL